MSFGGVYAEESVYIKQEQTQRANANYDPYFKQKGGYGPLPDVGGYDSQTAYASGAILISEIVTATANAKSHYQLSSTIQENEKGQKRAIVQLGQSNNKLSEAAGKTAYLIPPNYTANPSFSLPSQSLKNTLQKMGYGEYFHRLDAVNLKASVDTRHKDDINLLYIGVGEDGNMKGVNKLYEGDSIQIIKHTYLGFGKDEVLYDAKDEQLGEKMFNAKYTNKMKSLFSFE